MNSTERCLARCRFRAGCRSQQALSLVARALALISQWRGRDVLVRMPTDTTLGVDEHDDGVNEELAHLR